MKGKSLSNPPSCIPETNTKLKKNKMHIKKLRGIWKDSNKKERATDT